MITPATESIIPQRPQNQNPQPQQQLVITGAVAAPPSSRTLTFDEVSKLFSLPIAEAATILGVCTSVLKRICRTNGIIRWPYRKFLAGKSVEDIKRDAAREKNKGTAELSKVTQQRIDASKVMPSTSVGISSTFNNPALNRMSSLVQDTSKLQRGISMPGSALQPQDNRFLQYKWPNTVPYNPARNIPTYMDEFKYGFPAKGLSSTASKWWGSSKNTRRNLPGESMTKGESKNESFELSNETSSSMITDDQTNTNEDDNAAIANPSASLCALRENAVHCSRKTLKVRISKSHGPQKLGKKQRLILRQVFRSSLPDQWKDMFS